MRPGESGRPRVVYTAEDITHYRRSLEEQRGSEERFRRLYESNIIGIVSGDEERVIDANDVFLHMVGYTRADLAAGLLRWYDMTAPEFRHLGPQTIADVKSTGSFGPFEKEYLRKDGSRVSALIGCIRLQDSPYRDLCFVLDLTESKKLQQRVLEAQKFESVGVLAGGIAHDFNNLLVGIIGHASLAQDLLPGSHPARELLSHVVKNGEQAAHLTRQMLAYSGKGRFLLEPLNLSELYEEISILVKPAISKDIVLEMNLPQDLPPVEGDRGQMRQVFTNLVLNAAESITGRSGRIWVETGVRRIDVVRPESRWAAGDAPPGRYVYLEVIDTGCGMDEGTRTKIFDPFYTTKFVGRGLGLAAVAGIVRGHKGAISVTSTPGQGSRFLVLFPVSPHAQTVDAVERAGAQSGQAHGAGGGRRDHRAADGTHRARAAWLRGDSGGKRTAGHRAFQAQSDGFLAGGAGSQHAGHERRANPARTAAASSGDSGTDHQRVHRVAGHAHLRRPGGCGLPAKAFQLADSGESHRRDSGSGVDTPGAAAFAGRARLWVFLKARLMMIVAPVPVCLFVFVFQVFVLHVMAVLFRFPPRIRFTLGRPPYMVVCVSAIVISPADCTASCENRTEERAGEQNIP